MVWQYIIVFLIIAAAISVMTFRLIRFFATPAGKCEGCSGCALKEIKQKI